MKGLVIGLDGAEWRLIKPWIDEGRLPTFKRLVEGGSWGELISSLPPVTFPAWKCYSTGKNPGKLGVFWWADVDFEGGKLILHDSTSFKSYEFWDYMGSENIKVGIINMPSTYPPKRVNGFMIAGFPATDRSEYTYPPELKEKLKKRFEYRINPKHHIHVYRKEALDEISELIEKRFEVAREYINKVDFLHLTIFYLDDVQHFFWKRKELILEFYQTIDSRISELIDLMGPEVYLFIMSDHGFTGLFDTFYVNEWLSKKKYLVKKKTRPCIGVAGKLGVTQDRIVNLGKKTRLFPFLFDRLSRKSLLRIKSSLPASGRKIHDEGVASIIDWEKCRVVALKQGPVYLNKRKLSGHEYENLLKELKDELLNLRHPKTKEKIIRNVWEKSEIYFGKFTDRAPDLLVSPNEGYEIDMALGLHSGEENLEFGSTQSNRGQVFNRWVGTHRGNGIFLAYGPDIRRGLRVKGTRIYDLAPTLLHILKVPIPQDIDGRVVKEIFTKDSEHSKRRVKYQTALETKMNRENSSDEEMKQRLKALGYW